MSENAYPDEAIVEKQSDQATNDRVISGECRFDGSSDERFSITACLSVKVVLQTKAGIVSPYTISSFHTVWRNRNECKKTEYCQSFHWSSSRASRHGAPLIGRLPEDSDTSLHETLININLKRHHKTLTHSLQCRKLRYMSTLRHCPSSSSESLRRSPV